MFDNLLQLVKEHAGDAIVNNPAIPNEHNDAAISTAAGGIMDQLKGLASSGNLSQITSLFSQGNDVSSNPVVSNISSSVAGNLMSKFGINSDQASGVVQSLIPTVMNKLVSKTNEPSDNSFDLQGIMGSLGSGGMDGIMGGIKNMFG